MASQVYVIGGDGTHRGANAISQEAARYGVCVCTYICVDVYCVRVSMRICTLIRIRVYIHTHICIYTYIHVVCVCMDKFVWVIHICINACYMHT